jgi:hypothetical protein
MVMSRTFPSPGRIRIECQCGWSTVGASFCVGAEWKAHNGEVGGPSICCRQRELTEQGWLVMQP